MLKIIVQNSKYLLINLYNANTEQQQVGTLEDVSSMLDQIDLDSEYKLVFFFLGGGGGGEGLF